jgi:hypothetical protein
MSLVKFRLLGRTGSHLLQLSFSTVDPNQNLAPTTLVSLESANHKGETVAGFGNYEQPLYVEERNQIDASYQYRFVRGRVLTTVYLEVSNITDEPTRLYARHWRLKEN